MKKEFGDALNALSAEAEGFENTLNEVSDNIQAIEQTLRRSNIKTNFYYTIHDSMNGDKTLSWEQGSGKDFRIIYEGEDCIRKALGECKLAIRLENHRHLMPFVNALTEFLRDKKREMIDIIVEDDLEY